MNARLLLGLAGFALPAQAAAQEMDGMDMSHAAHAPVIAPMGSDGSKAQTPMDHGTMDRGTMDGGDMAGMDMSGMGDPSGHMMVGALGAYPMTRDASGTSWQPDTAPMNAITGSLAGFSTMIHGYATLVYDNQGGPRGRTKTFVESMLMGMAQRPLGGGTLSLRGMVSLDPAMGRRGYPLLLQSGETADGRTELVDRQHPHDILMELAAIYSHPLGSGVSGFVYFGLPGEPALGPATYMHRFSGIANPEAPIGHHWLDSTHITFGVATAGLTSGPFKLEGSVFTGREPDQYRWNFDRPRFDSWSVRGTINPTRNLSAQVSHGFLKSPEQLEPQENVRRTTASVTWNLPLGQDRVWQSTFAWGRNHPSGGTMHQATTDAFLLDSAIGLGRWTLFGRAERVDKDELFDYAGDPLHDASDGRVFTVGKLSLGGYRTLPLGKLGLDLGGLVSKYDLPAAIKPAYGSDPTSFMLFTRIKIIG